MTSLAQKLAEASAKAGIVVEEAKTPDNFGESWSGKYKGDGRIVEMSGSPSPGRNLRFLI